MTKVRPAADSLPAPAACYAEHQDAAPALPPFVPDTGIVSGPLRPAILRLALPAVGTTLFHMHLFAPEALNHCN